MQKILVLDRLRNPEQTQKRLEDYRSIQDGFPAFSVAEEGENGCLHYQGLVEIQITAASYGQKFKRKGFKGNKDYSTKQVPMEDKDRTLQYLCKGPDKDTAPNVVNNTLGLSYEQIWTLHQMYWTENESYTKDKLKKEDTFPMRLYTICERKVLTFKVDALGRRVPENIDQHKLVETILEYFCEETKVFDKFIIARFAMLIECKLYHKYMGGFKRSVVQNIVEMMN